MTKRILWLFIGLTLLAVSACGQPSTTNITNLPETQSINPSVDPANAVSVALARSWDQSSDDSNTKYIIVTYDPEVWDVSENSMYPSTFDLVHRALIGCSCSGSGPHGASPAWDITPLDRPLTNETIRVLGVYDQTSSQLLFVLYQFDQPQRYYLISVILNDLSAVEQEQCLEDAEVVLSSFNDIQP